MRQQHKRRGRTWKRRVGEQVKVTGFDSISLSGEPRTVVGKLLEVSEGRDWVRLVVQTAQGRVKVFY